ncbi:hypothetical protein BGZ63DRAFT_423931 [Mariannaea sp. PMI_226]|nr:hypothetical protein BGZ63DRAFT_423931 [Mariannaea sp. PMI_226]
MAAINTSLIAREALNQFAKRSNWASRNVGPMVVFCILGAVAILLTFLWAQKKLAVRRDQKASVV